MNIYAFGPIAAILDGAYAVLNSIITLLEPFAGGASAALGIVLITLAVRTALIPVGRSQARAAQTRARLAPRIRELQKRHGKDSETLQRRMTELYAEEKASPFAGCLPLLIQAPIISLVYALFVLPTIAGHANGLLTHDLLGVPLGSSLVHALGTGGFTPAVAVVFVVLLGIIAAVAWATRRYLAVPVPVATGDAAPATDPANPLAGATASIARVLGFAPFITVVIAAFVPLAAGVYLATTTTWTLVERLVLRQRYPLPVVA